MHGLDQFDARQALQLAATQWPAMLISLIGSLVVTFSLLVSGVALATWAVRTRFGWRRLTGRPARDNLLQLPAVLVLFLSWLILQVALAGLVGELRLGPAWSIAAAGASGLIALVGAIWLAHWTFAGGLSGVGLAGRPIGRDVRTGLACFAAVTPLVFVVLAATNELVRHFGHEPTPHPLLKMIEHTPDKWIITTALIAAIVAAPLWEEVFFRGIMQSFLLRFLRVMMPPKGWPTMAFSLKPPEVSRAEAHQAVEHARALGEQPPPDLGAPPEPESAGNQVEPLSPAQEARRAIAAILLAALLFAAVHPPTSIPAIFVLALALGYLYEVTGSLVCTIAMHAAFNGLNLLLLLLDLASQPG